MRINVLQILEHPYALTGQYMYLDDFVDDVTKLIDKLFLSDKIELPVYSNIKTDVKKIAKHQDRHALQRVLDGLENILMYYNENL